MAKPAAPFPWSAVLERLRQADPALAVLDGRQLLAGGGLTAAGQALEQLLQAGAAVAQAAVDVGLVADELRRYQKFAPPGRPSLQIVQLRRQQATVQQAQRVARQVHIRCADQFAREIALEVPARLGVVETVERWLRAQLPG